MSVLLQISDPHFGTEQPAVVEALFALAQRERPEVVVWSGDITQRARRSQFAAARQFAQRLNAPHLLAIPGNHDIPLFNLAARVLVPYGGFKRAFGENLEPGLSVPGLQVTGVNTTRPWRHKNGEVSRAQIERVAARLRQAEPGQLRVVVVHQPVWITQEQDRRNLLRGHELALEQWGAAGADIIMGGHIHLPYLREIALSDARQDESVWVVQAGTALSSRVRGGIANSVNLVRYRGGPAGRRTIERWDFKTDAGRFEQVSGVEF